jgi:hypothetical protein
MKRTFTLLFLGLAVMLGLSMAAIAQVSISYDGTAASSFGGVGTGLYGGTLNGGADMKQFICDDYPHRIFAGESWEATTENLLNLTGVLYINPNGQTTLQAYAEVDWLAENIFSGTNTDGSGITDLSTLSWAIWTILDAPPSGPSGTAGAVTDAKNWWASLSTSCQSNPANCVTDYNIYTPISGTQNPSWRGYPQEFLGAPPSSTTTPEPLSMALMGTFLTLAGFALGKKKLFF